MYPTLRDPDAIIVPLTNCECWIPEVGNPRLAGFRLPGRDYGKHRSSLCQVHDKTQKRRLLQDFEPGLTVPRQRQRSSFLFGKWVFFKGVHVEVGHEHQALDPDEKKVEIGNYTKPWELN